MSWANQYVGLPFRPLGRDRAGLDCWGLVRLIQSEVFENELPDLGDQYDNVSDFVNNAEVYRKQSSQIPGWSEADVYDIQEGDILMLLVGGKPAHCGVAVGGNQFIHIWSGSLSSIESYEAPWWRHRIESVWRYDYTDLCGCDGPETCKICCGTEYETNTADNTLNYEPIRGSNTADSEVIDLCSICCHAVVLCSCQGTAGNTNTADTITTVGGTNTAYATDALVIACEHPFRSDRREWHERAGAIVLRAVRKLKLPPWADCQVFATLNGRKLTVAEFGTVRLQAGDLLNLRVAPANKQMGAMGGQMALGAGALALLFFLSRSSGSTQRSFESTATSNNTIAPPIDPIPEPPPAPIANIGGAKDTIVPRIAGIANQKNNYGAYFRVYGQHIVRPFIIADSFVVPEGVDEYLYTLLCFGYGELDIPTATIKIGDDLLTDLVTAGLATYELRTGTDIDTAITIYPYDVDEKSIGETLVYNTYLNKTAGQDADKLGVDVIMPNGLYALDTDGNRISTSMQVKVEYRVSGSGASWTHAGYITATDNTTQAIRRGLTWAPGARALYEVRCLSQTPAGASYVNDLQWLILRSIRFESPVNPLKDSAGANVPIAYLALKIKASETTQGTINNLSAVCTSKLLTHNGVTWQAASTTRNPAWVFADMLCGTAFNRQLPITYLDATSLKAWADYCDTKGFTFNFVYDSHVTIQQALRDVCAAGRASPTVINGLVGVVVDNEKTNIIQMFTPANTWDFAGEIIYPVIPHALRVQFVNPDLDWQQDERVVFDDGYTETSATQYEQLQTIGVTSPTQAYKLGRYHLAAARLRPERFSLSVDTQHLVCTRGDRVKLNYDLSYHGLSSGRITAVTVDGSSNQTTITIDNYVQMDTITQTYGVRVRLSDGTFLTRQIVVTSVGETATVTWSTAIPAATSPKPAVGDLVSFGYLDSESVDMIIESIEHNASDMSARITMVDYSPGIFDADTGSIPVYNPQISQQITVNTPLPQPIVDSIRSDEAVLIREINGTFTSRIQITLAPPQDPRVVQVQWQFKPTSGTTWSPLFVGGAQNAVYVTGVQDGVAYDVWLRYLDSGSKTSAWTKITGHTVVGKTTPPPDVPELLRQDTVVYWRYDSNVSVTVPQDFAGFRVKFHFGQNRTWSTGNLVEDILAATSITLDRFPGGIITVLVKAVDVANNESTNVAALVLNLGDYVAANVLVTEEEAPAFTGTKTGCSISGANLVADDTGGIFWSNDSGPFWSGVDSGTFWTTAYGEMQYEWAYTPSYDVVEPFTIALDYTIQGQSYVIEYRTRGNSLFWETDVGADSNPYWTADSADFWSTDPPYAPWTGEIAGSNQEYDFRVTIAASTALQGVISEITVIVDVPDIVEYLNDVIISSSGTRLTLANSYRVIDFVNLTLQQDASYPNARTLEVIDKSTTGPLIKAYDSTHSAVSAKVDAIVQGH